MNILLLSTALALASAGALPAEVAPLSASVVQPWHPKAPPLPPPQGHVHRVSTVEELSRALEGAKPHASVLIADGHYRLERALQIRADHVTLRSASGQRVRVVLDGGGTLGEGIRITKCTGATIADLTLQNIRWNGIKIDSDTGVQRPTIYNCVLRNIWQRGIKGVSVPKEMRDASSPADCIIRYCLFHNERAKQYADDPADNPQNFHGNYIGGIDAMDARRWTISDNVFIGLQGRTAEGRGAIFLWQNSQDCVIQRNIIVDCDAGISLGNSQRTEPGQVHCSRFIVRNNFLTRVPENGIFTAYTRDCKILHNTIYDPKSRRGRLIRVLFENAGVVIANNLLVGPPISNQSGAAIALETNVFTRKLQVVDPQTGNLRLTASAIEAIDRAAPQSGVDRDIDNQSRGDHPDAGAHELRASTASPR